MVMRLAAMRAKEAATLIEADQDPVMSLSPPIKNENISGKKNPSYINI